MLTVETIPCSCSNICRSQMRLTGNAHTRSAVCTHDHDLFIILLRSPAHTSQLSVCRIPQFPSPLMRHIDSWLQTVSRHRWTF
jgi:hypothetical protein